MHSRSNPYTGFSTEVPAAPFQDKHGNAAKSEEELKKMTEASDYIEKQFNPQAKIPCGNCENTECVCPEPKVTDFKNQLPGKKRISFCG